MAEKKKVLVVGGTSGIGECIVEAFIASGYHAVFSFNDNEEKALNIEKKCGARGYKADVTNEEDIIRLEKELQKIYGKLDAFIYCPGIFEDGLIGDLSLDSWNRVLAANLTGAFLCAKHFLSLLRKSGHGRFVCIGSVMGESGIYGSCSYAASKAGLIGLVKSIALENAKYNVTANIVSLGYIDAGMTKKLSEKVLSGAMQKIPMKRTGDPKDAARIIVSLCEEYTNYLSGQVIRNNGLLYV